MSVTSRPYEEGAAFFAILLAVAVLCGIGWLLSGGAAETRSPCLLQGGASPSQDKKRNLEHPADRIDAFVRQLVASGEMIRIPGMEAVCRAAAAVLQKPASQRTDADASNLAHAASLEILHARSLFEVRKAEECAAWAGKAARADQILSRLLPFGWSLHAFLLLCKVFSGLGSGAGGGWERSGRLSFERPSDPSFASAAVWLLLFAWMPAAQFGLHAAEEKIVKDAYPTSFACPATGATNATARRP